jgi:hypothetical protein
MDARIRGGDESMLSRSISTKSDLPADTCGNPGPYTGVLPILFPVPQKIFPE